MVLLDAAAAAAAAAAVLLLLLLVPSAPPRRRRHHPPRLYAQLADILGPTPPKATTTTGRRIAYPELVFASQPAGNATRTSSPPPRDDTSTLGWRLTSQLWGVGNSSTELRAERVSATGWGAAAK